MQHLFRHENSFILHVATEFKETVNSWWSGDAKLLRRADTLTLAKEGINKK